MRTSNSMRASCTAGSFGGVCLSIAVLFGATPAAWAAAHDEPKSDVKPAAAGAPAVPGTKPAVTEHSIRIGNETVRYNAIAGTIVLKDDKGEPNASMFYVAYTRSDVKDPAHRPLTFFYNGGPGSSSTFLHMGAFGPKQVLAADVTATPLGPYQLVDNKNSLLDVTDEVFIDAVGTGFSKALGKAQDKDFWNVDTDMRAFGQFINNYVVENGRWDSPKFLMGESYGALRTALVGNYLQTHYFINLSGITLLSSALDTETIVFRSGRDLPYVLELPSYAATACYHKLLPGCPANTADVIRQARQFAQTEYASALLQGAALGESNRQAIAKRMAQLTGLSEDYLMKANLRVQPTQFMAELQRNRGLITGRLDSRFTGFPLSPLAETAPYDPLVVAIAATYTAAINQYLRRDLQVSSDKDYVVFSAVANDGWSWQHASTDDVPGAPNVTSALVQALVLNPSLRVQVEAGYYDLTTPFFESEYTVNHLELPEPLRSHVTIKYYDAGHMIYLDAAAHAKFRANVAELMAGH